jgi:hypothetical protein
LKKNNYYSIIKMSLSNQINELKILVSQCESEITSLESGRKASSSRARKSLQAIKGSAHTMRKMITETTKALPTKTRAKKAPVVAEPERVEEVPEPAVEPETPMKEKKMRKSKKTV